MFPTVDEPTRKLKAKALKDDPVAKYLKHIIKIKHVIK
jgi:hypothetical protein